MKCICNQKECTGCYACFEACKNNRIVMFEGMDGFKYAKNNGNEECHMCDFICPQHKKIENKEKRFPEIYAVQLKDESILLESTSGGMFYALSKYVIELGGIVIGAVYDKNMRVYHSFARNYDELKRMHGSKYVQSDMSETYKEVKSLLEGDILALFSGVPCQIAGLKSFLKKDYKNLITMDLICSGVPSPMLFEKYIDYLQRGKYKKVIDFKFRDKHQFGCSHTVVIDYINKFGKRKRKTIKHRENVSFYVAFGKENCFMDACYNCKYNTLNRISDFTVGGFWSLSHTDSKLNENKGVSLALVNTEKAQEILDYVKKIAFVEQYDREVATIGNRALTKNTPKFDDKNKLFEFLNKYGYKKTSNRYFKPYKYRLIKSLARRVLKFIN